MRTRLQILSGAYLKDYERKLLIDWKAVYRILKSKENFSKEDFNFYLLSASVESSRIEGNTLTLDDYLRNTQFNIRSKPKEMNEINDLLAAYRFAVKSSLNQKNFLNAHKLSSKTILEAAAQRGKLRQSQVGIYGNGNLIYMAVDYKELRKEFLKLFSDIKILLTRELSYKEIFYYAAYIHLFFEKIHPFADGNGRTGRLLEKWFIAEKTGRKAWSIPSEAYYMENRSAYYRALDIGLDYYSVDYSRSLPFLLMLPKADKKIMKNTRQ